jgi:hypothetical protein
LHPDLGQQLASFGGHCVSILPGIYASQITGHLITGSYDSIATQTVGSGGTSSISFTSIPSTYKHLQIRGIGRTVQAANYTFTYLQLNSDTGANYSGHELAGNGSAASAAGTGSTTWGWAGYSGAQTNANNFGAFIIDILDYANTNKYKTVRSLSGYDANGVGSIGLESASWQSTSAVSTVTLLTNGQNFSQYSSFALYGCK